MIPMGLAFGGLYNAFRKNPYLTGKEGLLPNWQIKGKGLKEIFAPEQYQKAGEMTRKAVTSRATALATGTFGIGAVEYAQGKEGWFPDWGRPGEHPKVFDTSGNGKGLVNIDIPPFPEIPEFPKIPDFPAMPDLSGLADSLAQGLAGLGAGLGAGIGGGMPSLPNIGSALGLPEDTDISPVVMIGGLGALAFIAYKVLKGDGK